MTETNTEILKMAVLLVNEHHSDQKNCYSDSRLHFCNVNVHVKFRRIKSKSLVFEVIKHQHIDIHLMKVSAFENAVSFHIKLYFQNHILKADCVN